MRSSMRGVLFFAALCGFTLAGCGEDDPPAECQPSTCASLELECGSVDNGCGDTIDCGTCAVGYDCHSGLCEPESCEPLTCESLGLDCGTQSDGCGETIDCGTCAVGYDCVSGLCEPESCEPETCESLGFECGAHPDECGETIECGACEEGYDCESGSCVPEPCVPETCESLGFECGAHPDECGDTIECGACEEGYDCESGICVDNPCEPNPCTTPPASSCNQENTGIAVYDVVGTCAVVEGVAECTYESTVDPCVAGDACVGTDLVTTTGTCIIQGDAPVCEQLTESCLTVPDSTCNDDATGIVQYTAGTCEAVGGALLCVRPFTVEACEAGAVCDGNDVVTTTGACVSQGGAPVCDQSRTSCSTEQYCEAGGCLPLCGNGAIDAGEVCDGADLAGSSCDAFVGLTGTGLACAADCQSFDTSGCDSLPDPCGDGVCDVAGGESQTSCPADCSPATDWTCDASFYADGECDCGCGVWDPDCADETSAACDWNMCPWGMVINTGENWICESFCGNDIATGDEVCDGTDLYGMSCADFPGLTGDGLGCATDCLSFELAGCAQACAVGAIDEDLGSLVGPAVSTGTTTGAGNDLTASCGGGAAGPDLAFTWSPAADGCFIIDTAGSTFDTVLHVNSCETGVELACNDDYTGLNTRSRVTLPATAGQDYVIVVDGYGSANGDYVLNIVEDPCSCMACDTPPADYCTGSVLAVYDPTGVCGGSPATCSYSYTTLDCALSGQVCTPGGCVAPMAGEICTSPATASAGTTSLTGTFDEDLPSSTFSCTTGTTNVVWFEFTASSTGVHEITAQNFTTTAAWSRLAVLDGASCDPLAAELDCATANAKTITRTVSLQAGSSYLIAFYTDGNNYTMVDPQLTIVEPLGSDPCIPNPCTEPPPAECNADLTGYIGYQNPGQCAVVDESFTCSYTPTTTLCATGFYCEAGACVFEDDIYEPNDSIGEAVLLPPGYYEDLAVYGTNLDFFAFELCAGGTIDIAAMFPHANGDIDIELQDENGTWLDGSSSTTDDEFVSFTNNSGADMVVYLRVSLFGGGGPNFYSLLAGVTGCPLLSCRGHVVISQVYGAGGNAGALLQNDYVELHNMGATTASLDGWSIQYSSATGSTWTNKLDLSGSIPAGGFFLIQLAGGTAGDPLPTPDATGSIGMAAANGKVALVSSTTALTGTCPVDPSLVDIVSYGTGTACEGSATPAISTTTAAIRLDGGCRDTDDNSADFYVAAPSPRNSSSPASSCNSTCYVNETGLPNEADYCVVQWPKQIPEDTAGPTVYGQIYENGVTPSAAAPILAQLGWGPDGVNPQTQAGFVYTDAFFHAMHGDNNEYTADLPALPAGVHRFTYRFSLDAGGTWTYCDIDGSGSNPGFDFDSGALGTITVP